MANELEIPYERVIVPTANGSFGGGRYRKLSPFGLVPALKHGKIKIFESQAILNYLGEQFPKKKLVPNSGTREEPSLINRASTVLQHSNHRCGFSFDMKCFTQNQNRIQKRKIEQLNS